ncbi:type I restriction enzyme, S subunit [Pseudorhodobacter antarcticus]|uniref:Type I restriction enzyme, S subunit n=1 Tax=Pseudorhodobacter antarcticus TaxID=1077947 RepID=A0A1H8LWN5_9RHOB|nr:restriction endonuclease subunit S [Pseudorhodobacter antarcticus]SEO09564.1 type I restriction enzyme, S subunit [Pseudorhodobacter antarcticus]
MKDTHLTAARLLALYDQVAEAEDAIPRLRRFVLDLAVRGKLVAQDAGDEPAAELLKRIAKEKARLVKAGEIRASKVANPPMSEVLYDLPANWAWASLGTIFNYDAGDKRDPKALDKAMWLLELEDLEKDTGRLVDRVLAGQRESQSTKSEFRKDDILYGKLRPYLNKVIVADQQGYSTTEIVAIRPFVALCSEYCALALRRPDFVDYVTRLGQGTKMPRLRTEDAVVAPFPLPPLAEQRRIVGRVDELMALCDQLQAARAGERAVRDRLTTATLSRLTDPDQPPEAAPQNARFALHSLPTLTTHAAQIKTLRQTILNLAVRGKLVAQDPTDEPAAELLKRIAKAKALRVKAGQIPKKADPVRDPVWGQGIGPSGWSEIALGQVTDVITSGSRGWGEFYSKTGPGFVRAQNIRFGKLRLDDLACVNPPSNSEGSRTQVVRNDLLIVITGAGVTNPALLDQDLGEAYVSQHVGLVRPSDTALSPWLLHCLLADSGGRAELVKRAYGAGKPGLNLDNIRNLTIPLPPLAEQHRIVARVDALMALCDQLESSLTTATTTRSRLLQALLHEALGHKLEAAE